MPSELENIKPSVIIAHKSCGQLPFLLLFWNVDSLWFWFFSWCVTKHKHQFHYLENAWSKIVFTQTFKNWQFQSLESLFFILRSLFEIYRSEYMNRFLLHQQNHGWFLIDLIELLLLLLLLLLLVSLLSNESRFFKEMD